MVLSKLLSHARAHPVSLISAAAAIVVLLRTAAASKKAKVNAATALAAVGG